MTHAAKSARLMGMSVAISGSIPGPEDTAESYSEMLIHNTVRRLAERILSAGGNLVYGSHPTFTEVIDGVAEGLFPNEPRPGRIRMYVGRRYYHAQPNEFAPLLTEQQYAAIHNRFAEIVWVGPPDGDRQTVLGELRERFIKDAHALVCIGGKGPRQGIIPGVGQEAQIAMGMGKPVFLMAWAGGYTRTLYRDWTQPGALGSKWRNPLSDVENKKLADPAQASDSIDLVLEGLARIRQA